MGAPRLGLCRLAAVIALAVGSIVVAAPTARAAVIGTVETELGFTAGVFALDEPMVARTVTVTQSGGSARFSSVADPLGIVILVADQGRCVYPDPPDDTTVDCDLSGIAELSVGTGSGGDHVTLDTALPTTVCGGRGDDVISGGGGPDLLAGAAGSDTLSGGEGDDLLRADHTPFADPTDPLCTALPGDPPGVNTLDGGGGADLLVGDDGVDTLHGGGGDDTVFGRSGGDHLHGGPGADLLVGLDGNDDLDGGPDVDVLSGGAGADGLLGGDGNDDLAVPVVLQVDPGGPVESSVETGDDALGGEGGDDTLHGGPGDRTVTYGAVMQQAGGRAEPNGADTMAGGPGRDRVTYVNREIPVSVSLDGRADDGSPGEGDDVASDVEVVTGGTGDDVLTGGAADDALDGGPGADTVTGLEGADTLEGGSLDEGADTLSGGAGADALNGGPGADALQGGDGNDVLRGFGGTDRLDGGPGDDDVQGDADADVLSGSPGADSLDGGAGTDVADYAGAAGAVTVSLDGVRNDGEHGEDWIRQIEGARGGPGADTLLGDAAANTLEGGPGDDLIDAGAGPDTVSAGAGRDAVLARDATRDTIGCGGGTDLAIVDEEDAVGSGAERCERADEGGPARRGEALLRPRSCLLPVRLPGMSRTVPLTQSLSVPRRTAVDAGACVTDVATVRRGPRARVGRGAFVLLRSGTRRRALQLRLAGTGFKACANAPASHRVGRLEVQAHGRVRVLAHYAWAAGRSARWTMDDRCGRTVTRVLRRRVRVHDSGHRGTVTVRAGRAHVSARPRGGGR
jgi:Ca2+-binding RTX toxin-like protein